MAKTFDISEAIWIKIATGKYHICLECINHKQGDPQEYYDCKNVFVENGESVGQCCCYSEVHGKREA